MMMMMFRLIHHEDEPKHIITCLIFNFIKKKGDLIFAYKVSFFVFFFFFFCLIFGRVSFWLSGRDFFVCFVRILCRASCVCVCVYVLKNKIWLVRHTYKLPPFVQLCPDTLLGWSNLCLLLYLLLLFFVFSFKLIQFYFKLSSVLVLVTLTVTLICCDSLWNSRSYFLLNFIQVKMWIKFFLYKFIRSNFEYY